MRELYIIGAGGFGREVADTVREINNAVGGNRNPERSNRDPGLDRPAYRIVGFIDDDEALWGKTINGIQVTGGVASLRGISEGGGKPHAVMAIGNPDAKRAITGKLGDFAEWETVIHPSAILSPSAEIGAGTILQANAFISANAVIGRHCCVNCFSSVGHDAVLGDYVSVMSHCDITGNVKLEEDVYIATSVAVIPGITIGKGAFAGAGSVVLKNVEAGTRVLGYPARRIG
jgi:sugar O-acyltransferase (sialic acid O-acetyltransferase NeuD family)